MKPLTMPEVVAAVKKMLEQPEVDAFEPNPLFGATITEIGHADLLTSFVVELGPQTFVVQVVKVR